MLNRSATILSLGLLGLSLAACQSTYPLAPPALDYDQAPDAVRYVPGGDGTALNTIDDYKFLVAQQILQANSNSTFSGQLPPMLPAVVVLSISVDRNGELTHVAVQRSRDDEASGVALAAVKRCGPFPRPLHLLHHSHKTLNFSETFLFNAQQQFQLRTLAGPQ